MFLFILQNRVCSHELMQVFLIFIHVFDVGEALTGLEGLNVVMFNPMGCVSLRGT